MRKTKKTYLEKLNINETGNKTFRPYFSDEENKSFKITLVENNFVKADENKWENEWANNILQTLKKNKFKISHKGQILKLVFQQNKARQIFLKFIEYFLSLYMHTYVCVLGGKKRSFFGKFDVLYFLGTPILRLALLPYYRQIM